MPVQSPVVKNTVTEIPLQTASADIWDSKYRLKTKDSQPVDKDIDATYSRVAKALAEVEETEAKQKHWYKEFLWALRHGAIPAGRITSNAGALAHKPATSTINCTVSGNIHDSMDDILHKVHEAGLTLKAGCVAPDTLVYTEKGCVTAQQAVTEQHQHILSYDRQTLRFEMKPILKHLTTVVPQHENIEITSHLGTLTTSIKHPVLVYRYEKLQYVRADDIQLTDALVHYQLPWEADKKSALKAWFAGAHLGDGSAYEKQMIYANSREKWQEKALAHGKRLVFKIRAAEREVVERYALFFQQFYNSNAKVVSAITPNNTPVWDFTVASFSASAASEFIDNQIGKKSHVLKVPQWIRQAPEKYFLPFLAGLIDTDGTVNTEHGSAGLSCQSQEFAKQIQSLLALFGVHAAITHRKARAHDYYGHLIKDSGGYSLKISDSEFLLKLSAFMADSGKKHRIQEHQSQSGQYDDYVMSSALTQALSNIAAELSAVEKQQLGIYHGKHLQPTVSRIYLNRWANKFPQFKTLIDFVRQLRPVTAIQRNLEIGETFYDFSVDTHNNYLAGNNGMMTIHNCGIGYEFSTLRPKDAYVSGAGAYTSGPLSFMDIYDKMCFTVSSAGGRRGAQMATFDIGHPDVVEFIRAKREDGRLRQFNLSLLITHEFMEAVKNDQLWPLSFPLSEKECQQDNVDLTDTKTVIWRDLPNKADYITNADGLVACRVAKTIPARRLWDIIMTSTYDYAEPGFILIDKVNEMNNNWYCENIRATNPCLAKGTLVHTPSGFKAVETLKEGDTILTILGQGHIETVEIHHNTAVKQVRFSDGSELLATDAHIFHKVENKWFNTEVRLDELKVGDKVRVFPAQMPNNAIENPTDGTDRDYGFLLGIVIGDGCYTEKTKNFKIASSKNDAEWNQYLVEFFKRMGAKTVSLQESKTSLSLTVHPSVEIRNVLDKTPLERGYSHEKKLPLELVNSNKEFLSGFLDGVISTDGNIHTSKTNPMIRISTSSFENAQNIKRVFSLFGIHAKSYASNKKGKVTQIDGRDVQFQHENYVVCVLGSNIRTLYDNVKLSHGDKQKRLEDLIKHYVLTGEMWTTTIKSIEPAGTATVYDLYEPVSDTWITDGIVNRGCGEQPLPPYGSCLLGSINLTKFVVNPFTEDAYFDWETYRKTVQIFTRMLDNVVEINGLPLAKQREEIMTKRRHGMGYLGLGSTLTMLGMKYGEEKSLHFTDEVTKTLAVEGWKVALELAKEKGTAPVLEQEFTVTGEMLHKRPEMITDGYKVGDKIAGKVLHSKYSRYMQQIAQIEPELVTQLIETGARFTHHSSIAPTGTISLSLANNASNGIEPSFAHHYSRNVIKEGKKSKEKVDVYSFELLAYRHLVNPEAMPYSDDPAHKLPDYFISADEVTPKQHVDIQAAAQKWIDSSISKTANVPTDYPYEDFKHIYQYAYEQGLKGCTTFRFNPEVFQGVLVKESDLENTTYQFTLEDGSVVEFKGNDEIEYDGEIHSAANLFDALKEGYYGKF